MIGGRLSAQAIGWALKALPDDASKVKSGSPYHSKNVPWHRVLNAKGAVSKRNGSDGAEGLQEVLLRAEGVEFDGEGKIDLSRYLWRSR